MAKCSHATVPLVKQNACVRSYKQFLLQAHGLEKVLNTLLTQIAALELVINSLLRLPVLFIEQTRNPLYF